MIDSVTKMPNDIFYTEAEDIRFKLPEPIVNKIVGARLKERRLLLGLNNQADLGKKLQISGQQIHKYEAGTDQLSVSKIHELGNILQVPISYFFEDLEIDCLREAQGESYSAFTPEEAQLQKYIGIYKQISDPKLQKMLVEVAKLFAAQLKLMEIVAPKVKKEMIDRKTK